MTCKSLGGLGIFRNLSLQRSREGWQTPSHVIVIVKIGGGVLFWNLLTRFRDGTALPSVQECLSLALFCLHCLWSGKTCI